MEKSLMVSLVFIAQGINKPQNTAFIHFAESAELVDNLCLIIG